MRALVLPLALLALLAPTPAGARLQVAVDRAADGLIRVKAEADVAAPLPVLWGTLTDYENLPRFVPDLKRSRVISDPGEPLVIEQEGVARVLFLRFPIRVTLALELEEDRAIVFRAVTFRGRRGNLREMSGAYRIEAGEGTTRLRYEARLRPEFWVPSWLGTDTLLGAISRQIQGIVDEAQRRAAYDGGKAPGEGRR